MLTSDQQRSVLLRTGLAARKQGQVLCISLDCDCHLQRLVDDRLWGGRGGAGWGRDAVRSGGVGPGALNSRVDSNGDLQGLVYL